MSGALLSVLLTLPLSVPSEIFPYLVVVIGLENVLVLTKSVVSTPVDLEVKLRIAQGNRWGVRGALGQGRGAVLPLPAEETGSPGASLAVASSVTWQLVSMSPEEPWSHQAVLRPGSCVSQKANQTLLRGSYVRPFVRLAPGLFSSCLTPSHEAQAPEAGHLRDAASTAARKAPCGLRGRSWGSGVLAKARKEPGGLSSCTSSSSSPPICGSRAGGRLFNQQTSVSFCERPGSALDVGF